METMGFVFGMAGFTFGLIALVKSENLEKKLKELKVIPNEYDSLDDAKE